MTATTTTPDRAEISRQNGRKSRGGGPKTPQGKARSRMNALKHGMTASLHVLPGEDLDAFRRRVADFIAAAQPRNAIELAVTEQAALATWKIARGERAAAARARTALRAAEAAAGLGNHDEVAALGQWLLAPDLRAKQEAGKALFPFLTKDRHDPFGRGRGEPRHIVLRLEASAAGCQWLIDRWAKLRVWLDQGADWRTNELIAALQLRGQRPLAKDAIEWQDLVEPILPTENPEAIAEARRRMLSQFAAGLPDDPAGQRAALWRLVAEETERLLRRQAGHQRREAADLAELADRLAVDTSPEGELMRRYQLDNDRKLDRAINNLVKLRRGGVGVAGDPAPDGALRPSRGRWRRSNPRALRRTLKRARPTPRSSRTRFSILDWGFWIPLYPSKIQNRQSKIPTWPSRLRPGSPRRPEPPPNRRATPFRKTNCHAPPGTPDPMRMDGRMDSPLRLNSRSNPARPLSVVEAPRGTRKTSPAHRLMAMKPRETNPTPRPTAIRSRQTNPAHRSAAIRSRQTNRPGRGGSPIGVSRPWSGAW